MYIKLYPVLAVIFRTFVFTGAFEGPVNLLNNDNNRRRLATQIGSDITGESENSRFGGSTSISADGLTIAAGGEWDPNGGLVRVYNLVDGSWTQIGEDLNGVVGGDLFGSSVALSEDGTRLAVGARQYCNDDAGYVRVFELINGAWVQLGQDLVGDDGRDTFGRGVAISADGSMFAVGADGYDEPLSNNGVVRVYRFVDPTWVQVGADIYGDEASLSIGYHISMSGDGSRVAIGVDRGEYVRVYQLVNDEWEQQGEDIQGGEGSVFGYSVVLSSDGGIVAAGGLSAGVAKVFAWTNDAWTQRGTDIEGYGYGAGQTVGMSSDGQTVAVSGGITEEYPAGSGGDTRVFQWTDAGEWEQTEIIEGTGAALDWFGASLAMSSDGATVIIGGWGYDSATGLIRIYDVGTGDSAPVASPTADSAPVASPTAASGDTVFDTEVVVDVVLGGVTEPMSDSATETFEETTEGFITDSLSETVDVQDVEVTVTDQTLVNGGRFLRTDFFRSLQTSGLAVTFTQSITYTASNEIDSNTLVQQAFEEDTDGYVELLQNSGDATFSDLAITGGFNVENSPSEVAADVSSSGGSPSRISPRRFLEQVGLPLD